MSTIPPSIGIIGIVQGVRRGNHGRYAWASVYDARGQNVEGYVTFSLHSDHKVWKEKDIPVEGTAVVLEDLRVKPNSGGWRAMNARYARPEDGVKLPISTEATHETSTSRDAAGSFPDSVDE